MKTDKQVSKKWKNKKEGELEMRCGNVRLHVWLQLQVNSGCVLISLLGNMFPQARVGPFIISVFQQFHFFITNIRRLTKMRMNKIKRKRILVNLQSLGLWKCITTFTLKAQYAEELIGVCLAKSSVTLLLLQSNVCDWRQTVYS